MPPRNCNLKRFRKEPYMTPNNYDLYFSHKEIPVNIKLEDASNLNHRLQRLMPLGKFIHLNMDEKLLDLTCNLRVDTEAFFRYSKKVDGKIIEVKKEFEFI